MIRLEIYPEGQTTPLVPNLSPNMSFEMICENPLFERRGDYTYDIDISMRDPHNRKIYQHIDRLTAKGHPKGRKAKLLCGGETVCEGMEVVLKKEDDNVKIQILAGLSELNILTADDNLRIREMNFGTIPVLTPETPAALSKLNEVANKIYPQTNYVFPVLTKDGEEPDTNYTTYCHGSIRENNQPRKLLPQPFLLYYVEKFVELLGYNLTHNDLLGQPKWCRLVVIHGYNTWDYAKMLPDWSAAEFLRNIEKFFNCVFVVDRLTNNVEIKEFHNWYSDSDSVIIDRADVIDNFIREYDNDEETFYNYYNNVSYKLPSGDFWRYASLSEDVIKNSEMLTMYPNNAASLQNCDWKIFTHPDYGYQYVRLNNYFQLVNQFAPFVSNGDAKNTELKIIPAEIIVMNGIFATDAEDPDGYDMYNLFNVNARPQIYENTNNTSFKNLILKDETEKSGDVIQVAYYAGIILHRDQNGSETRERLIRQYGYGFPVCFTQQYHIYIYFFAVKDEEVLGARNMSLELNGTNGLVANVYENEYKLDITQKTTVLFKSSQIINPNCIFHIAGRQFICKQLKYTFSNGKRHPVVEGVFFPYNS